MRNALDRGPDTVPAGAALWGGLCRCEGLDSPAKGSGGTDRRRHNGTQSPTLSDEEIRLAGILRKADIRKRPGNDGRPTPTGVGLPFTLSPAASYSPTPSRVQYHRR